MTQKHWLHTVFDGIGLTSLVISIFALGGASWFVEATRQGAMLAVFNYAFITAVTMFVLARCVQIALVVSHTPDPKRLRAATDAANRAESGEIATDIRRAA